MRIQPDKQVDIHRRFLVPGLFASCFRFPLTPVVFAIELTGTRTYNLVLPVAVSCFTGPGKGGG